MFYDSVTIRITGAESHPGIWYANKVGREYRAEMGERYGQLVYFVTFYLHVHIEDCEVVESEKKTLYFDKKK